LAQSFEESRTHAGVPAQATLNNSTADLQKAPTQSGSRLVGRLEIPNLNLSSVILEGVGSQTLRVGLGHVPGTSMPGQPGNVVIAGHRDTFFRSLRKMKICDELSIDTTTRTYYYQVRSFEIVDPHNVNALRFHDRNELTLITCYPFSYIGPAPNRFVVHAEPVLVPEKCSHS
jgi:sortase A